MNNLPLRPQPVLTLVQPSLLFALIERGEHHSKKGQAAASPT